MMKRMIYFVITFFFMVFGSPINAYASSEEVSSAENSQSIEDELTGLDADGSGNTPSDNILYDSYEYVIDKYDINIVVNEDNTFNITETITACFHVPKHGIYRRVPLNNTVTRLDGTISKNRAQITNLWVDNAYTTYRENGNYIIKIGSDSETFTGEKTYKMSYTYNLGKDPLKDSDEIYFNIIGNEWDTVIGNVTFTITMPKAFDAGKLGFSSGAVGSTSNDNVKYTVSGNTISGSYEGILDSGQALTVRCELPEGYFVGADLGSDFVYYIIFLIPLLLLCISGLLWFKFGRDEKVVETVEFYPPAGFNSLEVGFLYKGKADSQDVTSLLVYLANEGYIKISETEGTSLFSKMKGFKITKLKEYDGNNINEQLFLNGLFRKKMAVASIFRKNNEMPADYLDEVTSADLYDNFYVTMNRILSNINNKENKYRIFKKSAAVMRIFVAGMMIIAYSLITIPPIYDYGIFATFWIALLFPPIGMIVLIKMVFGKPQIIYVNGRATYSATGTKMFGLVWGLGFGGVPWAIMMLPVLKQDMTYLAGYIWGLVCILGMFLCFKYLPQRTPYGNQILGKIMGFRNYLETAEKDKLEAMVMQDPAYFYNILPYTYVLGVSDKWIKKFETIFIQEPVWYDSPGVFDMTVFGAFMDQTMAMAGNVMSSSPSSSSGGSSGGGSSGGGSGGGGGGSW